MIKSVISTIRKHFDDRRRYSRILSEIEGLSQRDLRDLRADPTEMARSAHAEIYGKVP